MIKYCLLLLVFCFTRGVDADDQLPTSLSIAAPEIPPLVYYNERQELVGTLVEKLNVFSRKTGIKVSVEVMTWARALAQVKHNQHDALMPTIKTPERENYLSFPELALINFKSSVFIQRETEQSSYNSLELLITGKTIAKARSMSLGEQMDLLIRRIHPKMIEVNSIEAAIQMLDLGRVDFVATDKSIALSVMKKLALKSRFHFIEVGAESSDSYLAFSQKFSTKYDVDKLMKMILATNDSEIFTPH